MIPIVIGKGVTIHHESLEFLKKLKGIQEEALYQEIGVLVAKHYSKCLRKSIK